MSATTALPRPVVYSTPTITIPNASTILSTSAHGMSSGTPIIIVTTALPPNISTTYFTIITTFLNPTDTPRPWRTPITDWTTTHVTSTLPPSVTVTIDSSMTATSTGALNTKASENTDIPFSHNTGAIVGVVFGGVIALVFVFLWILLAKRTRDRRQKASLEGSQRIIDFAPRTSHGPVDGDDDPVFDHNAMRAEAGGPRMSERYEEILSAVHPEDENSESTGTLPQPSTDGATGFNPGGAGETSDMSNLERHPSFGQAVTALMAGDTTMFDANADLSASPSRQSSFSRPPTTTTHAPTFNNPSGSPERSLWLGGTDRQVGYHGTASPTNPASSREELAGSTPAYGNEWNAAGESSDHVGLAIPYQPSQSPSSTHEPNPPAEPGNHDGRHSPRDDLRRESVMPTLPPTSYTFRGKRSSSDSGRSHSQSSLKGFFGRFRNGGKGAAEPPSSEISQEFYTPRTSIESGQRAGSSRAPSRLQHGPSLPLAFLQALRPSPTPPPPPIPPPMFPPPPTRFLGPAGSYPPAPPSPSGTEGSRDRLEGLLDPRLVLRLAEGGQHSLTSFADHEDYTRRIAAVVNNEMLRSTATFDTPSHEDTASDHHENVARAVDNARTS